MDIRECKPEEDIGSRWPEASQGEGPQKKPARSLDLSGLQALELGDKFLLFNLLPGKSGRKWGQRYLLFIMRGY